MAIPESREKNLLASSKGEMRRFCGLRSRMWKKRTKKNGLVKGQSALSGDRFGLPAISEWIPFTFDSILIAGDILNLRYWDDFSPAQTSLLLPTQSDVHTRLLGGELNGFFAWAREERTNEVRSSSLA